MKKHEHVTELMTRRILNGEYQLTKFPTVRELAVEAGVSKVTAQTVVKALQANGLIAIGAKGQYEIVRSSYDNNRPLQVAYLGHSSPENQHTDYGLIGDLRTAATASNCNVSHVLHTRWDDPVVLDVLSNFDGVFFEPLPNPPAHMIERICQTPYVVMANQDYTQYGLPSIQTFPAVFVQRLLEHLEVLGHRQIDCLNVQPIDSTIDGRLTQWKLWMSVHRFSGQLINDPVELGKSPVQHAYEVTHRLLDRREQLGTAILCITGAAAVGAMRAMHERNIRIGTDIAICATHEEYAPYLISALTTLKRTDAVPFFSACLQWMQNRTAWAGPLLLQPHDTEVIIRESTNPRMAVRR